jgi:hypothetical protein
VRQGVMQLRTRNLIFKHPEIKCHFWQSAVQEASKK